MSDYNKEKEQLIEMTKVKRMQNENEFGGAGTIPDTAVRLVPTTPKEKLDNFWYYHKNVILGIIFFIIAATSYYFAMVYEPESDGTITIIAQPFFYDSSDYLGETWSDFATDLNDDGKTFIKVIPIQSDPNGDYGMDPTMYQAATLAVRSHIKVSENFLFMLDETNYLLLKEQGVEFTDLSQFISTDLHFDNELYSLKDSTLSKSLGFQVMDIMYFALVDFSSLSSEMQAEPIRVQAYQNDLSLFQSLISH